jgi:hypothetical protein
MRTGRELGLDANIRDFFGPIDHGLMTRFLVHRMTEPTDSSPHPEVADGGSFGGRALEPTRTGTPPRGSGAAKGRQRVSAVFDFWVRAGDLVV